jgi:hypothetical protein
MAQPRRPKLEQVARDLMADSGNRTDGSAEAPSGLVEDPDGLPLFILSPVQRDELSLIASRLG